MKFEDAALQYFNAQVPVGFSQRIDGIACFSPLPKYWFWKWRLNRMVRKGLLRRVYHGSMFASASSMPWYGLPD